MIRFLYGENTYSVSAMAAKIVADFVEKQKSDLNLNKLDADKLTLEKFSDAVLSTPFLGDKKMTVIKNLLVEKDNADLRKKLIPVLEKVPATSEIVFIDNGKPDARDALYKFLIKNAQSKNYALADEAMTRRFILTKLEGTGVKIDNKATAKLSLYVGPDLWRLQNEVLKLSSYALANDRKEISADDVEKLVEPNLELKVFDLTDALATKNSSVAIEKLNDFIRNGEDLMMVFNLVIYQLRNMIVIKDLTERKETNIAKTSGLHPFVVKKTLASVQKISLEELKKFYRKLEDFDAALKTSEIEIEDALVLLFVDFCKNDKIN